jgi:hypothetical protein
MIGMVHTYAFFQRLVLLFHKALAFRILLLTCIFPHYPFFCFAFKF